MRVLALTALNVPYIRDNWADALRHVLADDVTIVDASAWLAFARTEAHMKAVYRLIATGTYDYLFLYHDYIFADFPDEFFAHVRSAGVRTLAFHPDDEPDIWYERNRAFDARYNLVASHATRGVARRIAEHRPTQAIYLPWGFNPRFFNRPQTPVAPRYDVVFIGKHKVHDRDARLYREDGRRRDDTLVAVANLCEQRGWRFGVFGYGWERHPRLSKFAGGLLSHEAMIRTYHESRIVLNPGWAADEGDPTPQTKLRHFEVPGCGAFQLTNRNAELADLFTENEEIAFFDDAEDLCQSVEHFLTHDEERQAIADRGYARTHREHTLDHRVATLFDEMTARWPATRSAARPRPVPTVQTIRARTMDDVRKLRDDVRVDPHRFAHTDLVHVLACDAEVSATNYEGLRDWWQADAQVFAGRCVYHLNVRPKNPLQPQRSEMAGGFLTETNLVKDLSVWRREQLPQFIPGLVDEERACFLLNHLARPTALPALLDAFLSGAPGALDALQALPTGLVLTEIHLPLEPPAATRDARRTPPAYAAPLETVLRQAVALHQRVGIYGARGDMAETALDIVSAHRDVRLVGLFDRALAGSTVGGVPVHSAFDLPKVAPDVLLIAAQSSGPAIYEQLKPLEAQMALVPLYDLDAPVWSVIVPPTVAR